ncbi:hypothetical protein [Acinetobacter sp. YH12145]|uniref:hypothetical protein n=1 Tax=Acinetobacter sp. YH12145 TaxID=2601129 RepID=UPI0015D22449|nr:hypothetical protein [Acinetobacter sp. YH12145]
MKIKRISTSETVSIEDGFFWSDEFSWKAKEQSLEYAMDGTPIIQEGTKLSGRPITLEPADSGMGWASLGVVRKLQAWSVLNEQFQIQFEWAHDTRIFNVVFNHVDGALEATPVKGFPPVSLDDPMNLTLRFWSE